MDDKKTDVLLKYIAIILFGAVFAGAYIYTHKGDMTDAAQTYKVLSDGLAIPGVIILGYGLIMKIASTGALDGATYGVNRMFRALIPGGRLKKETYGEYVERKSTERKSDYLRFIIVGGIMVAGALLFMILFNQVYTG